MKSRMLKAFAAASLTLLALTGCTTLDMNLQISEDGTTKLDYQMNIDKTALEQMGSTPEDFEKQLTDNLKKGGEELPPGVTVEPVESEDTVGMILHYEGPPAGDKSVLGEGKTIPIIIKKVDDTVNVTMNLFAQYDEASFKQMVTDANITVSLPGDVSEASHGAKVEGNKATWTLEEIQTAVAAKEPLVLKGSAVAAFPITPQHIWIVAGVLLGLSVIVFGYLSWKRAKTDRLHQQLVEESYLYDDEEEEEEFVHPVVPEGYYPPHPQGYYPPQQGYYPPQQQGYYPPQPQGYYPPQQPVQPQGFYPPQQAVVPFPPQQVNPYGQVPVQPQQPASVTPEPQQVKDDDGPIKPLVRRTPLPPLPPLPPRR